MELQSHRQRCQQGWLDGSPEDTGTEIRGGEGKTPGKVVTLGTECFGRISRMDNNGINWSGRSEWELLLKGRRGRLTSRNAAAEV